MKLIQEIIKPENDQEKAIVADPDFIVGTAYGRPRRGHPEGEVIYHIKEVLANVDKYSNEYNRKQLRLIAIIHDTFKYKVDRTKPKIGENHHAMIARRFAEKYHLFPDILEVIELHDEAYNSWQMGAKKSWYHAEERATKLLDRLNGNIPLYITFYMCDNLTGDKERDNYDWFMELVKKHTSYAN